MKRMNVFKLFLIGVLTILFVPTVISNAAEITELPEQIILNTVLRDFTPDTNPDFESYVGFKTGITKNYLNSDKKPIFNKNKGVVTDKNSFEQWYNDVPGVNKRLDDSIALDHIGSGVYEFRDNSFFPLDNKLFGNYKNGHNYHFTMELHTSFTYQGGEQFEFFGDDDLFVFINGKLVIDIGGVHPSLDKIISLDTLGLTLGQTYDFDLFFAERHTSLSNFHMTTSISFITEEINEAPIIDIIKPVDNSIIEYYDNINIEFVVYDEEEYSEVSLYIGAKGSEISQLVQVYNNKHHVSGETFNHTYDPKDLEFPTNNQCLLKVLIIAKDIQGLESIEEKAFIRLDFADVN